MAKKAKDYALATLADLDDATSLFFRSRTDGGGTKGVTLGVLRASLFGGVDDVIALGLDASGVDAVADDIVFAGPRSTGSAITPNAEMGYDLGPAIAVQVAKPGATGAGVQSLETVVRMMHSPSPPGPVFVFGSAYFEDRDESLDVYFGSGNTAPTDDRYCGFSIVSPSSVAHPGAPFLGLVQGANDAGVFLQLGFPIAGLITAATDFGISDINNNVQMALSQLGDLRIAGTLKLAAGLVAYGANDSGGAGRRLMTVPNA